MITYPPVSGGSSRRRGEGFIFYLLTSSTRSKFPSKSDITTYPPAHQVVRAVGDITTYPPVSGGSSRRRDHYLPSRLGRVEPKARGGIYLLPSYKLDPKQVPIQKRYHNLPSRASSGSSRRQDHYLPSRLGRVEPKARGGPNLPKARSEKPHELQSPSLEVGSTID